MNSDLGSLEGGRLYFSAQGRVPAFKAFKDSPIFFRGAGRRSLIRMCFRKNIVGLSSTVTVILMPSSWSDSTCHSQSAYEGLPSSVWEREENSPDSGSIADTWDLPTQNCESA
jgi:hypothetical protein